MTIYCMRCGKELPDDANFCLKCGKQVGGTVQSIPQPEPKWEYCEIVCIDSGFLGSKSYFVAQAVGSKGRYEAARSTKKLHLTPTSRGPEPSTDTRSAKLLAEAALDEIMTKLSADGWELTGQKGEWWEYKYRRREHS